MLNYIPVLLSFYKPKSISTAHTYAHIKIALNANQFRSSLHVKHFFCAIIHSAKRKTLESGYFLLLARLLACFHSFAWFRLKFAFSYVTHIYIVRKHQYTDNDLSGGR